MQPICKLVGALLLAGTLWGQLPTPNLQSGSTPDAIAIVVTRFGPYPASLTHSPSAFLLSVVNRSGILEDTFSLVSSPSGAATPPSSFTSLLDLHSTGSRQRDHRIIQPLPGNYQLLFKSHPDWVVNIAITAN